MDTAHKLYRCMNGLFPLYKPPNKPCRAVSQALQTNLANALNAMQCRPMRPQLVHHHHPDLPSVTTTPDLSDHPLVVGARYQNENFKLISIHALSSFASGVTVMAINGGIANVGDVIHAKHMKVYHIGGMLGKATVDHKEGGKILERSSYDHVSQARLGRVLAGIQASHQKHMNLSSGIDLQSEEAYELAQKGLIRPSKNHVGPVIYAVRCISFQPPYFTIELHSINETCQYLLNLIHNLGLQLKTNAVSTQIRRIRHGIYSVSDALLPTQASDPYELVRTLNESRVDVSVFKNRPVIGHLSDGGGLIEG